MNMIEFLGDRAREHILDIGAGTGRNALPLARAGFATDALELSESFCRTIQQAAEAEELPST